MNSKGIPFNDEMVRALLNTKPGVWPAEPIDPSKPWKWQTRRLVKDNVLDPFKAPYGPVGRHLWVKETWVGPHQNHTDQGMTPLCYKGTNPKPELVKWTSPRYMPREFSRFELEVKEIRIQKINAITETDIIAEGCPPEFLLGLNWFKPLWEKIHGPGSWEKNDFVFAYDFMRVK